MILTLKHYISTMAKQMNQIFTTIDTEEKLKHLIPLLRKEKEIAVDTEGNSLYRYHPAVCLIQISTRTENFIIDTIEIKDYSCLKQILSDRSIEKVFHGSTYDIQMLYQCADIKIKNLFDTQIAASFLGEKKTGLASLVKKYFGVQLSKTHQKSNWAKRPLSGEMLGYAISDTLYLLALADLLKERLKRENRIDWVKEECEVLSTKGIETKKKQPAIPGKGKLSGEKLNIVEAIIHYREQLASEMDLPAFRVLDKYTILKIAGMQNINMQELRKLTSKFHLDEKIIERMLLIINEAKKNRKKLQSKNTFKKVCGNDVREKIEKIYNWRSIKSEELKIQPHLILSQKQIFFLAESKIITLNDISKLDCLRNWQKKTFGEELVSVLY